MRGRPYTLYSGTDNLAGSNTNRIHDIPGSILRFGGANRQALASRRLHDRSVDARSRFLGGIGRNTERGDSLVQFNVSLGKTFTLAERTRLQFRAEAFNLLNTVNYDLPDGVLSSRNFGQAVSAFDSRQMQFALKLTF